MSGNLAMNRSASLHDISSQRVQNDPLWVGIRDFPLGGTGAHFPFSRRLARDNGWRLTYADRVVEEYRRFCYLAARAGHPVTPSEQVDQAWHLHILYTQSYWDDFCGGVLKFKFHHGPTRGGAEERAKFRSWYRMTLDSYRRFFGANPPRDVWPRPEKRFRHVARLRWVNTATNWVVPKPSLGLLASLARRVSNR